MLTLVLEARYRVELVALEASQLVAGEQVEELNRSQGVDHSDDGAQMKAVSCQLSSTERNLSIFFNA